MYQVVASGAMAVLGIDHVAFRTPDPVGLREFYAELLGAEPLEGSHGPLRAGHTLLVFFESDGGIGDDELAFDVDGPGFEECLGRARTMGLDVRGPVEHTAWSHGFYLSDPDGRRIEIVHNDDAVFWQEG